MAKRRVEYVGKKVVCTACNAESVGTQGKLHRRCPGQEGQKLRDRHDGLPVGKRGTWN